nr:DUF4185 domain-containing protein [Corynebacterium urealyticum]
MTVFSGRRGPFPFTRRGTRTALLVATFAASSLSGMVATAGTASAAGPCSAWSPGSSDTAAALGSSGSSSGSSTPSWLKGIPGGMPSLTGNTTAMHILTGPNGPDQLSKFGLASTDLGFMWDAGDGRTLAVFGDSFSCGRGGDG